MVELLDPAERPPTLAESGTALPVEFSVIAMHEHHRPQLVTEYASRCLEPLAGGKGEAFSSGNLLPSRAAALRWPRRR